MTFFIYGSVLYKVLIYIALKILPHYEQNLHSSIYFSNLFYFLLKAEMLFTGLKLKTNNNILKMLCKEAVYIHYHF